MVFTEKGTPVVQYHEQDIKNGGQCGRTEWLGIRSDSPSYAESISTLCKKLKLSVNALMDYEMCFVVDVGVES